MFMPTMLPHRISAALLPILSAGALLPLAWLAQDAPVVQAPVPAADDAAGDAPERFGADVLARIGQVEVTREEYEDHLFQVFGLGALEDLIYVRLLEAEAARMGVTISAEELEEAWESAMEQLEDSWGDVFEELLEEEREARPLVERLSGEGLARALQRARLLEQGTARAAGMIGPGRLGQNHPNLG